MSPERLRLCDQACSVRLLGGDNMGPPELGQNVITVPPVPPVSSDMVQGSSPVDCEGEEIAPFSIKYLHQPLYLQDRIACQ